MNEEYNLCSKCREADTTCPVYEPDMPTFKCVEWKPLESILIEDFIKMSTQNAK
jgi:hypothetical protein